jgi:hypothetical protein
MTRRNRNGVRFCFRPRGTTRGMASTAGSVSSSQRYAGQGAWNRIGDEELSNSGGLAEDFMDSGPIEDAKGTMKTCQRY